MGLYGGSLKSSKGRVTKNQYIAGISLKGGLGQFPNLKGGLAKKRGGSVFEREGVDSPMHTMDLVFYASILYNPLENMLYYLTLINLWVAIHNFPITLKILYIGLYDQLENLFLINGNSF